MLGKLGNIDEISKSDMSEWLKRSWEAAVLPLNYARKTRREYFCLVFRPLSSNRRVCKIAWQNRPACATARRDFAHAVGHAARRCTPYTSSYDAAGRADRLLPELALDATQITAPIGR